MLWGYAKHGGAEAARVVERDDHLVFRGKLFAHAVDQMNLRSHGELCAPWRVFDDLDQALGRSHSVSFLADLKATLRMHDDLDVRIFGANFVHVFRQEALMHGAMALPENHARAAQPVGSNPAHDHERVPDHALIERNAHGKRGVAAEVLVGKEKKFLVAFKGPAKGCGRVRRGANYSATLAAERFDGRSGVHVSQRRNAVALLAGESHVHELVPATFDLADLGHVSHGASGVALWQDDLLAFMCEHIRALCHEVDAAEDNVFRVSTRAFLGKFVGVTAKVGEANDFVALVVMAKDQSAGSERTTSSRNAGVHGVVGEHQVIFERARRGSLNNWSTSSRHC